MLRIESHLPVRRVTTALALAIACSVGIGAVDLAAQPEGPPPPPPVSGPPPPLPPDVLAQRPDQPPPDLPDPAELREQLSLLYEFLSAPPDKLAQMRKTIETIEAMSPEDREFLRMRLVQLQEDAPALQAEIAEYAEELDDKLKTAAGRYWLSLRKPEREEERSKLEEMEPTERQEYLQRRIRAFQKEQEEMRSRMQDPSSGPPKFIPPPPPFVGEP